MNQPILLYRSGSVYANETAAWAALDAVTHKKGQPIVAFYTLSSPVSGHHGSSTIGAIFAIGIGDGVGQYKACTSHDDMLIVAQSLNAHITQFNQMFEYDATNNAIKAKLDFYTTDGKSISAGGIGSGSSASLGALYQLVDVMANSSNTGVEGAVEGSVLAYDATAGKWKAIAQSEILPDMSGYYTKDETDSAINTAKSNLQGQVDTLKALIPATASADNQLADKDFVNSSIATATAEFRGSFTSLDELKATSGNLNDYAFYLHTDDVGNSIVDRYKWTTAGWLYEYTLNNSSFTAEQWSAINSTITATLVQSYNNHLNNSTIHITAAERTAWNNKWDYNENTIKAVKVNAAVNADNANRAGDADTLDGYHSYAFRKDWGTRAGGSYIGWVRIMKWTVKNAGGFSSHPFLLNLYREYASPATESYTLSFTFGWNTANIVQLNGNGGVRIIEKFRISKTADQLTYYLEYYVNPEYSTYANNCYCIISSCYNFGSVELINEVASGDTSTLHEITTKLNSIVGNIEGSATKLATPRTIWGQRFDGSGNVSGDLTEVDNITASGKATIQGDIVCGGEVVAVAGEGTPAGVTDYSALTGKPAINGVTLVSGNNTLAALGIQAAGDYATNSGVTTLLADYATKTFVANNYAGKSAFNSHTADTDIHITATERTTWNAKWTYDEATIKAVKVTSASSADSVAWTGISGKPTTFTPSAHTHAASDISGLPTNLSAFTNDVGYITGITKSMVEGVLTGNITSHTHSYLPLSGGTLTGSITLPNIYITGVNSQLPSHYYHYLYGGNNVYEHFGNPGDSNKVTYGNFRFFNGNGSYKTMVIGGDGTFAWDGSNVLDASNYNSYAPTLKGKGASGTWGISISGNAATAAKLQTPCTIWGQSFDGMGNVSGALSGVTTISASGTILVQGDFAFSGETIGKHPFAVINTNSSYYAGGFDAIYPNQPTTYWNSVVSAGVRNSTNDKATINFGYRGQASNNNFLGLGFWGNDNIITILANQNVGIGTTSPQYKLDVNGNGHFVGDLIVDGEVSALVA